jgi:hypothetical protein
MVLFRRSFLVPDLSCAVRLQLTADSRYRLYVNGKQVLSGPAKGDEHEHYYDTVDVSSHLQAGINVLGVMVLHYAPGGPLAGPVSIHRSLWGGLLLDGELMGKDGGILETLHSDERWLGLEDCSYRLADESGLNVNWLGGMEQVDGRQFPHGWQGRNFEDREWQPAVPFMDTHSKYGVLSPWRLAPRPIPHMTEEQREFAGIKRLSDVVGVSRRETECFFAQGDQVRHLAGSDTESFRVDASGEADGNSAAELMPQTAILGESVPSAASGLLIPPHGRLLVELDATVLTTGYLRAEWQGGKEAELRVLCAECYEDADASAGRHKGIRDDCGDGRLLRGDSDRYIASGSCPIDQSSAEVEAYEPFWFRTFRYVQLEIRTGNEPLLLQRFHYRETGYPLSIRTQFACSSPRLEALWPVSIHTLKQCMHETYEDCPYYEQLQYAMDTFLQMLFHLTIDGDARLGRKAIRHFHHSRLPSGLLQSRYPCIKPQIIPVFSLYWIMMLHCYYLYTGDEALVLECRETMDGVLQWFHNRITPEGLVGTMPSEYWNYMDWAQGWDAGVPEAAAFGPLTVHSLLYIAGLKLAAELSVWSGRPAVAEEYRERAELASRCVEQLCWSEERQLYRDGPKSELYSEHAQLWAVLSGVQEGEAAGQLMERSLKQKGLVSVSYSMSFFLFRALSLSGRYSCSFELWEQWYGMLDKKLTTWAEDAVQERSDCHGWGSIPLYEFPSEILGVTPLAPGYSKIAVAPKPGPLDWARGTVNTPRGPLHVEWRVDRDIFKLTVRGPAGIPLRIELPNGVRHYYDSGGDIELCCRTRAEQTLP